MNTETKEEALEQVNLAIGFGFESEIEIYEGICELFDEEEKQN